MRKLLVALLSLMLVLPLASHASASPFLAAPAARTLLVNLVGSNGAPLPNAEIHLLTPGVTTIKVVRTDDRGQATLTMPDGFSYWLRVWADGHALIERPYVPASDGPVLTLRADAYTTLLAGLVRDDRGRPVPQATVTLYRDGYGLETTAMTNEAGVYTMRGIRADGSYTLQVEAPGFQPLSQALNPLSPNSRNQVDLALTRAFAAVTGEVVDARNAAPVSGMIVELLLAGWGVVDRTTTDSLGYFFMEAPPANGSYQVRLSRPDFETTTTAAFTATGGGWVDFSGADRIAANRLYAKITGKVMDENDRVLPKIQVHLQRQGLGTVEVATTDENGRYRFIEIPGGTYRVRAFPEGDLEQSDTDWLTVVGGQDMNGDITADFAERGNYGLETLTGTVKDHLGDPVKRAIVTVRRGSEKYTVQTDDEGHYTVTGLKASIPENPGEDEDPVSGYHVMVTSPGFLTNDQPNNLGAAPPSFVTIVDDGDNVADFTMQPQFASLGGRVLSDLGLPVEGVQVALVQEGKNEPVLVTTDRAGRYIFGDLPVSKQGRYYPALADDAYVKGAVTPDGTLIDPTTLTPANPTTFALAVRPSTGLVTGLVQAGDDQPATGALVTVIRSSDKRTFSAEVKEDGSYLVRLPLKPGDQYLVRATAPGSATAASGTVVSLENNFGTQVNLTLHPTAAVTGRVYGPDGKPREGVRVVLYSEGRALVSKSAFTDATGRYRFDELVPGRRYAVVATDSQNQLNGLAPGELVITPLIALPSGETQWADLTIPSAPAGTNP